MVTLLQEVQQRGLDDSRARLERRRVGGLLGRVVGGGLGEVDVLRCSTGALSSSSAGRLIRELASCSRFSVAPTFACSVLSASMFVSRSARSVVRSELASAAVPLRRCCEMSRSVSSSLPSAAACPLPSSEEMSLLTWIVAPGPICREIVPVLPVVGVRAADRVRRGRRRRAGEHVLAGVLGVRLRLDRVGELVDLVRRGGPPGWPGGVVARLDEQLAHALDDVLRCSSARCRSPGSTPCRRSTLRL